MTLLIEIKTFVLILSNVVLVNMNDELVDKLRKKQDETDWKRRKKERNRTCNWISLSHDRPK